VDAFNIPQERFKALLARVELLYSVENPYHCALHAAVRRERR
jgi:cAMP-specific phosphodiesterase 4